MGGWYWLESQARELSEQTAGQPTLAALDTAKTDTLSAADDTTGSDSTVALAENNPEEGGGAERTEQSQTGPVTPPVTSDRSSEPRQTTQRPAPQQPAVPQVGWLTVNSNPFGSIWIDDVFIQETPLFRHQLSPGTYVLEIRRQGFQTVVDTVRITARNEVKRQKILVRIP